MFKQVSAVARVIGAAGPVWTSSVSGQAGGAARQQVRHSGVFVKKARNRGPDAIGKMPSGPPPLERVTPVEKVEVVPDAV
jgi:hypothetical protein